MCEINPEEVIKEEIPVLSKPETEMEPCVIPQDVALPLSDVAMKPTKSCSKAVEPKQDDLEEESLKRHIVRQ